jgi:hypothetical protein
MCLQEFAGMIFFAGGQRLRISTGPVPSRLISSIYSFFMPMKWFGTILALS